MNIHKYDIVVEYIEEGIKNGTFKMYGKLPSMTALQIRFNLSRCSVFKAMESLKERGIIESEPAVGYFVVNTRLHTKKKVMLIFGQMNPFKEVLYKGIVDNLDEGTDADIAFHYLERRRFEDLLASASGKYHTIVVNAGYFEGLLPALRKCKGRILLLDHCASDIAGAYSSITQDFDRDTYDSLVKLLPRLRKYERIVLISKAPLEPVERIDGLERFGKEYGFETSIVEDPDQLAILPKSVYLVPSDWTLVKLVKKTRDSNMALGKEIGIIALNEWPINEVFEGGLTTITTDFKLMGEKMAEMINSNSGDSGIEQIRNPIRIIVRNSV